MAMLKLNLSKDTKNVISKILKFVKSHGDFLVSAHIRADGDALGSALALNRMLKKMGKTSHVVSDRGTSPELAFMPESDKVGANPSDLKSHYDAVLTTDTADFSRLERIKDALPKGIFIINIDHHASNTRFGNVNWIDDTFSSSGEMVFELVKSSGVKIDKIIATNIYVAMVTDTGSFGFSNTKYYTHLRAAELINYGAEPAPIAKKLWREKERGQLKLLADCINNIKTTNDGKVGWITLTKDMIMRNGFSPMQTQDYIDAVKSLKGVQVAILLREADESGKTKVSWRTEKPIDGVKLAARFSGGGHPRASGATVHSPLKEAEKIIVEHTISFLKNGN